MTLVIVNTIILTTRSIEKVDHNDNADEDSDSDDDDE